MYIFWNKVITKILQSFKWISILQSHNKEREQLANMYKRMVT